MRTTASPWRTSRTGSWRRLEPPRIRTRNALWRLRFAAGGPFNDSLRRQPSQQDPCRSDGGGPSLYLLKSFVLSISSISARLWRYGSKTIWCQTLVPSIRISEQAMPNSLRSRQFLGPVTLAVLFLFCASFVPCHQVRTSNCCPESEDCNGPICDGGASCHCACAFSGIPLTAKEFPALVLIESISMDTAIRPILNLTHSLDRPPRLS